MQLNNCEKRYVDKLCIALCLLEKNAGEHRYAYELERERCKKNNEDFVVPSYVLGTLTKLKNETHKLVQEMVKKFNDVEFGTSHYCSRINRVIDNIYDQIEIEKAKDIKAGITVVIDVDAEKDSPWLPHMFCDKWVCVWFTYKYIDDKLSQTLTKYGLNFNKVKTLTESYHKFFIQEIMACRG